jgi:CHASE3 domain sensor protein
MSDSPLLRRARERMAKQREQERERWEIAPAALQKSMIRWILRILAIMVLVALVWFRLKGLSLFR